MIFILRECNGKAIENAYLELCFQYFSDILDLNASVKNASTPIGRDATLDCTISAGLGQKDIMVRLEFRTNSKMTMIKISDCVDQSVDKNHFDHERASNHTKSENFRGAP